MFAIAHSIFGGDLVVCLTDTETDGRAVVIVKRRDPFGEIIPERPFAVGSLTTSTWGPPIIGDFATFTNIDRAVDFAVGYSGHYKRNASV
jgi:hypothetical protein